MRAIEKWQSVFLLAAIASGLALSQVDVIERHAAIFVFPLLFMMLYGLFLSVSVKELKTALSNKTFALVSVGLNFVWTPVVAWGIGAVFLADHPVLWLGFIMLLVTPCTDWYLVFTGLSGGNVPLSAALLPVNLLLQLVLLPVYVRLFTGTSESFHVSGLAESIILIVVLPFLLARMTDFLLQKGAKRKTWRNNIHYLFADGQVLFLSLAIAAIFASQGNYLFGNELLVLIFLMPLLLFYLVNFIAGHIAGRLAGFSGRDKISLHFTTLARNSPLALSVAYTAFPDQPLLILALVTGSLIELPVLAVFARLLPAIQPNRI